MGEESPESDESSDIAGEVLQQCLEMAEKQGKIE